MPRTPNVIVPIATDMKGGQELDLESSICYGSSTRYDQFSVGLETFSTFGELLDFVNNFQKLQKWNKSA